MEIQHFEHLVVELKTDTRNIILVAGYRPPNTKEKIFLKEYNALVKKLGKLKHHEILIGLDHNLDLLKAHLHIHTHTFLENNLEIDLLPCISKPTRVTRITATLIENILISQKLQQNVKSNIIIDDISDHFPLLILLTNQRKSTRECKLIKTKKLDETALEKNKNRYFL